MLETNAKKKSKRVELGWMNFNARDNDFKQVRSAKGGGTRHVSIDVNSTMKHVQEIAEGLFFTNGKSKHLDLKSLDCEIRDFSHRTIESECTIGDLYEASKVKILRLYLFTMCISTQNSTENSVTNPESDVMLNESAQDDNQASSSTSTIDHTFSEDSEETSFMLHDPLYIMGQQISVMQPDNLMEVENGEDRFQEQMITLSQESDLTAENVNTLQVWSPEAFNTNSTSQNVEEQLITADVEETPFEVSFVNEVIIGGGSREFGSLDDTVPIEDVPKMIILVRRGQVLCDLMQAFNDPAIMDK